MERWFSLAGGAGWLTVAETGDRAVCAAQLPADGKGLYKCWLLGPEGKALVGTFVPEGGELKLSRTLPVAKLKGCGAWPPTGAEAVMAFSFAGRKPPVPGGWRWEPSPGRLMGEPLLARAAGEEGALLRREAEGFSLAYPFDPGRPFPLTPLFCFARLERLEGRDYLVFPFRPVGCPRGGEL